LQTSSPKDESDGSDLTSLFRIILDCSVLVEECTSDRLR
jgi:hypothetical protein